MRDIPLKEFLEAGCHFGHQVPRWNPKAAPFIYTARDKVHIIDLAKTKENLGLAAEFIKTMAAEGGNIIFVGTKRQAKSIVEEEAKRVGAMYLVTRWLGGLLTNWEQIKKNIDKLNKMRLEQKTNAWQKFTKKEQLLLGRELIKLESLYGGVASLSSLPTTLFLVDIKKEEAAVREAVKTGVKTVAIVDTNVDPNLVDYPIPANDDALGSIRLITAVIADAYEEGKKMFEKKETKKTEGTEEKKTRKVQKTRKTRKTRKSENQ